MLKVAIVGCGKIADEHVLQIRRIRGCEIVGVCDQEPLMARQLYERFPIKAHYNDLTGLLRDARPDVAHITTPPQTHFDIARHCLERGCNVYVEKPFTLDAGQAEHLVALADEKGLKLTVGHDRQFSHVVRRMRALVASGYLGGAPVHMESFYCYDLSNPSYARALLGDKRHWVRRLPGKLLQNVISHGIARIAEFLTTDSPQVIAHGFASPQLKALGEDEIFDELRVIISEREHITAYFTFSSQTCTSMDQFRVYGSENGLFLDHYQDALIKLRGKRFRSYVEKFAPSVIFANQHLGNLARNARLFLGSDLHMNSGMKFLMESFYRSIREGTSVPIPYSEILRTARIMDKVFEQLTAGRPQENAALPSRSRLS